jgi:hypothetical protein
MGRAKRNPSAIGFDSVLGSTRGHAKSSFNEKSLNDALGEFLGAVSKQGSIEIIADHIKAGIFTDVQLGFLYQGIRQDTTNSSYASVVQSLVKLLQEGHQHTEPVHSVLTSISIRPNSGADVGPLLDYYAQRLEATALPLPLWLQEGTASLAMHAHRSRRFVNAVTPLVEDSETASSVTQTLLLYADKSKLEELAPLLQASMKRWEKGFSSKAVRDIIEIWLDNHQVDKEHQLYPMVTAYATSIRLDTLKGLTGYGPLLSALRNGTFIGNSGNYTELFNSLKWVDSTDQASAREAKLTIQYIAKRYNAFDRQFKSNGQLRVLLNSYPIKDKNAMAPLYQSMLEGAMEHAEGRAQSIAGALFDDVQTDFIDLVRMQKVIHNQARKAIEQGDEQALYQLVSREVERQLLPYCKTGGERVLKTVMHEDYGDYQLRYGMPAEQAITEDQWRVILQYTLDKSDLDEDAFVYPFEQRLEYSRARLRDAVQKAL